MKVSMCNSVVTIYICIVPFRYICFVPFKHICILVHLAQKSHIESNIKHHMQYKLSNCNDIHMMCSIQSHMHIGTSSMKSHTNHIVKFHKSQCHACFHFIIIIYHKNIYHQPTPSSYIIIIILYHNIIYHHRCHTSSYRSHFVFS